MVWNKFVKIGVSILLKILVGNQIDIQALVWYLATHLYIPYN